MGRPAASEDQKFKQLVVLKGPQKWIDWVERLSKKTNMSVTEMFDVALTEYAKGISPDDPHPGRKIPALGPTKKKKLESEEAPRG